MGMLGRGWDRDAGTSGVGAMPLRLAQMTSIHHGMGI